MKSLVVLLSLVGEDRRILGTTGLQRLLERTVKLLLQQSVERIARVRQVMLGNQHSTLPATISCCLEKCSPSGQNATSLCGSMTFTQASSSLAVVAL